MDLMNQGASWFSENQGLLIGYGVNIVAALLILIFGFMAASVLAAALQRVLEKRNLDKTISHFIGSMVKYSVIAFVIIAALSRVGVQTASFIAVLGAAGLAVGLALQGSLSNFASGVLIIGFRPFKAGDFVEIAGTAGSVETVQIFSTVLVTPDNKMVVVPNSSVLGGNIVNYSRKDKRRLDLVISVSYSADLAKTKQVLESVIKAENRILSGDPVTIGLLALADSSVNFAVRPWVRTTDYWPVHFALMEAIKLEFDKAGIQIPFPQMDIHLDRPEK
jgi:small conductance mechanosensitive channel